MEPRAPPNCWRPRQAQAQRSRLRRRTRPGAGARYDSAGDTGTADLAVVGPMVRTANDLTLLFDIMLGPDPLTLGVAHDVSLSMARHDKIRDFRVLILDGHLLLGTSAAVEAGVDRVGASLAASGAPWCCTCLRRDH
ncbi:amidase family protein [Rhodococcus sp. H29-C3]|uniref:amidase family protein n=1 Tax=Rhodococcus sp. H29-C3 TaxID=3046307 RepID=UPI0024BB39C1|nr:amidase family protein [Rhodococcus sp. H29-C3]MDJ0362451.1 amidase family protein [Rhodococcus sp. H29-C3]